MKIFKNILVAVDFNDAVGELMAYAESIAEKFGAKQPNAHSSTRSVRSWIPSFVIHSLLMMNKPVESEGSVVGCINENVPITKSVVNRYRKMTSYRRFKLSEHLQGEHDFEF